MMKSLCDKNTIEIIGLKRPTALDKLAETIPMPKGAIPNFGLPKWKVMPLESKIPMVPGPEGAYNFTRRKVGQRLWISAQDAEFNLNDPYCYEMKMNYDSLHDKHLVPYFSKRTNLQLLIKAGLITKNLDAKCSLRDYNMYRKYLRKLHCDSIKKELRKRARLATEERALRFAEDQARKEVKRLRDREQLVLARKAILRKRKLEEKRKRRQQRENQNRMHIRLQKLLQDKEEARKAQLAKSKAQEELIRQKHKNAADIERRKIIQTLVEWSKKERVRTATRNSRLAQEREQRVKLVEQKWKERQEFQQKQIEKEKLLHQCRDEQREQFIQSYEHKINRETQRMKRLLERVKMYLQCYMARRSYRNKNYICCEKYFYSDEEKPEGGVKKIDSKSQSRPMSAKPTSNKANTKEIKQSKRSKKTLKPKEVTHIKGGPKKRRVRKRRRRRKLKKEDSVAQSEGKESASDIIQETESAKKAEKSDSSTDTVPQDKCRCQIIQAQRTAAVQRQI